MPNFIKKYELSFWHERPEEGFAIPVLAADGVHVDTLAKAVTICRIDLQLGDTESYRTWDERRIGVAVTSPEDSFNKAHGRQVALLRAVSDLDRTARTLILGNWFAQHMPVHGAKAGDPKKFRRLAAQVEFSDKTRAWMSDPMFYHPPQKQAKSA